VKRAEITFAIVAVAFLVWIGRTEKRFHESELKFKQEIRNEN